MKTTTFVSIGTAVLLLSLTGCGKSPDRQLSNKLVGTWSDSETSGDSVLVDDETTYLPNGTFNFSATIQDGELRHPVLGSGTWHIKEGYLNYKVETSNVSEVIPNGFSTADKILRITDTEFAYVSASDGKTKVLRRVR